MTSLTPQPGIKAAVSAVPILSSAVLIQPIRIASHRAGYRRMLNYGRHNVAASAARRRAANGKIIGLCSAGRKNDLVGVATEKSRDLTTRVLDGVAGSPAVDVPPPRVAEVLSQVGQHGLDDLGQGLRRRIVVEVDGVDTHAVTGFRETMQRNAAPIVPKRARTGSIGPMSRAMPAIGGK